jgi:demethylmenaquinone methyltransferase/2-methoxy-6-polyprenyl-1,4-benzoquinol methylase
VQKVADADKSRRVRDMFGSIAGRYDFLNHFLSANVDRRWRKICVQEIEKRMAVRLPRILDIGCGTADLSLAFSRLGPVFGCDFCHPMLRIGANKIAANKIAANKIAPGKFAASDPSKQISLLEADALALPFADASFDAAVSAFVLRNLVDIDRGFCEMRRILKPGGAMGVLEFGMPRVPCLATLYRWYFLRILPKLGGMISGVNGPYGYLRDSVQAFPPVEELKNKAEKAGFVNVEYRRLTAGIAILLTGEA